MTDTYASSFEHVVDFGIVTALRDEMIAVLTSLGVVEEIQSRQEDIRYYYRARVGCLDGSEQVVVCVLATETGQQPALNATRDLIAAWKPRHVILVGIAGGIAARGVKYGDLIVPRRIHYYEPGKLTPKGRRQRGPSFDAGANLQSAVEALAIQTDKTWLNRIREPRPDGKNKVAPRILRDELASGEEVWAHLGAEIVREVLDRYDKVLAVDNEAAGVFNAVHESTHKPDVLVVKAASDLVNRKDDRWRRYAAKVAAVFAVALIEKIGGRWDLRGSRPSLSEDAEQKLDTAREWFYDSDYEAAARLSEEAADLAAKVRSVELERKARITAARAWHTYVVRSPLTEVERQHVMSQIEKQVRALELLDVSPADLALERSRLAILNMDAASALKWASEALEGAEEGSVTWVDALITCIQAHWQSDQPKKALEMVGLVQRARSKEVDGQARLAVDTTWLRTLSKTGKATQDDITAFSELVRELVASSAVSPKQAMLVVGEVAAEFNRRVSHSETFALLELAYELGEQVEEPAMVSSAALQAAEIAAYVGDASKVSLFLAKASAWAEKAKPAKAAREERAFLWSSLRANWLSAKGRILVTLAERSVPSDQSDEEMLRQAFDVLKEANQFVLNHRAELRGDVELFLAELHWWWGLAAYHLNWFNKAIELFRAVRSESAMAHPRFAAGVAIRAWLHEAQALTLAGRLDEAGHVLNTLLADPRTENDVRSIAESLQSYLQNRLRPVVEWFGTPEANVIVEASKQMTLREAVAEQVAPLVAWWTQWHGVGGASRPRPLPKQPCENAGGLESVLLDFWGRGGFSRLAAAIRAKPHAAITVDARSTEEVSRWARVLCPLFDTVVVKWKGELGEGMVIIPVHESLGGPGSFGGHGYAVTLGTRLESPDWTVAVGWANPLPAQVCAFLAQEALPLIASGRLVVIPASLTGCTQSAVGWTDNLLVDGFLGGVVDVVRRPPGATTEHTGCQRVLDLSTISIPYIENISLGDLARVLEETEEWVPRLRSLLLKSILSGDLRYERWASISVLENEIRDACRELHERLECLAPAGKWRVTDAEGSLSAASHGGSVPAREPVSDLLRSIASTQRELAPWIPYWRMNSLGGRLDWSCPLDNPSKPPPQPTQPQALHSWLYPGTGGWGFPIMIVPSDGDT